MNSQLARPTQALCWALQVGELRDALRLQCPGHPTENSFAIPSACHVLAEGGSPGAADLDHFQDHDIHTSPMHTIVQTTTPML